MNKRSSMILKSFYIVFPAIFVLINASCSTHSTRLNPILPTTKMSPTETGGLVQSATPGPEAEPATPTYPPMPTRIPDSWKVYTNSALTITEYPIVDSDCDPWVHFDGFQARLRSLNLNNATRFDEERLRRAQAANRLLEAFGYRLASRQFGLSNPPGSTAPSEITVFDLYQGDTVLTTGITQFGQVSVSATGADFILWVQDTFNSKAAIEVRRGSVRTLNWWESGFNTAWVGTNLIRYAYASDHLFPIGAASQATVYQNDETIYSLTIPQPGPAGNPVKWLWFWQGQWLLEAGNVIVQNGVLQNPLLGYDEMFGWHLVNDKHFYFFQLW